MNLGLTFTLWTITFLLLTSGLSPGDAAAQTPKDLVGTWTLASVTIEQGGKTVEPSSGSPTGSPAGLRVIGQ